jgi:hypothetical protein
MIYHPIAKTPTPEIFAQMVAKALVVRARQAVSPAPGCPVGAIFIVNISHYLVYNGFSHPLLP